MVVFGTRPEAIKMLPVVKELKKDNDTFDTKVVVTAQHRDMLDSVLRIFQATPDYDLNVMKPGQTLNYILASVVAKMEEVVKKEKPDIILVHGDTTTSMATALTGYHARIPVGHVEAGLRSFDFENPWPEEMNRVITDKVSTLLFAPTEKAKKNLWEEGIQSGVSVTGNTVIDTLLMVADKEHKLNNEILKQVNYNNKLILVTAHRRENFGEPLKNICGALYEIKQKFPDVEIIYAVHPNPNVHNLVNSLLPPCSGITLVDHLDYEDFVELMKRSYMIVTDSGGLQEEGPALSKPVLVMRNTTERPEAVEAGTAILIGTEKQSIINNITFLLTNEKKYATMSKAINPFGDGHASERIVKNIGEYFNGKH